jgi:GT2 family glycosyltransferase
MIAGVRNRNGVTVAGKFLQASGQRFWVKGVTYGTFAPADDGYHFPSGPQIVRDFATMSRIGVNTVRTYTLPSPALLDAASICGLRLIVGVPWAQHVAFLDDRQLCASIRRDVVSHVRMLQSHPSVALIALGNEIPAPVVRWQGKDRVQRFLREIYTEAKSCAPDLLFTYVNYPPTEYLDLPFLDVAAFNVYLHRQEALRAYLARLQNLAGDKPLLLAEAGVDSIREGQEGQAALTSMQLRTAFEGGACGAVAFAWTDEWWRGGHAITDWAFGLVDAQRRVKPALRAVADVFAEVPFAAASRQRWPKVSVVVCAYNAADTIGECLASLEAVTYPNLEVIVVNDGSQDATGAIARRFPFATVFDIPNGGLSAARNVGLAAATGEIVAYTDSDVRVEPDWLDHLVQPLLRTDVVGVGGANLTPQEDSWMAHCVGLAPGGPTPVMIDDRIAEHVPGCNMAFWRRWLVAINGFNATFLRAGDDVDVCWRLQAQGGKIGFAPAALVWHHPRPSAKAFWRQQVGYGEGETWLRPLHPDKFKRNRIRWQGHIYSPLPYLRSLTTRKVNTGVWGTSPFPSVYQLHAPGALWWPHTAAWTLTSAVMVIAGLSLGWFIPSAFSIAALGVAGLVTTVARCISHALATDINQIPRLERFSARTSRWTYRGVITWFHFIQPLARARGRLRGRFAGVPAPLVAAPRSAISDIRYALQLLRSTERQFWFERWISVDGILEALTERLKRCLPPTSVELDDGWCSDRDLRISVTEGAAVDLRALVEDHGSGRSLLRIQQRLRMEIGHVVVGIVAVGSLATVPLLPADSMMRMPIVLISIVAIAALAYGVRMAAGAAALVNEVLTELALGLQASELRSPARTEVSVVAAQPASRVAFVLSSEVMPDPIKLRKLPVRAKAVRAMLATSVPYPNARTGAQNRRSAHLHS